MKKTIILDGVAIPCAFRFEKTPSLFPNVAPFAVTDGETVVSISDEDWAGFLTHDMPDSPETEFSALTSFLSDALVSHDRVLVHAVAFSFRGKAYLIAAPSGVGKSTQIKTLQALHPGEFEVICGDRPILRLEEDRIMVCPSPWNGKENWKGAPAGPLDGIILLDRGEENYVREVSRAAAAASFFPQVIQTGRDPETIEKTAEMTTRILTSVPKCNLVSFQVPDSTLLLYKVLTDQPVPDAPPVKPETIRNAAKPEEASDGIKEEKRMIYKTRPGILTTKICGVTTLIPTRAAMDQCSHIQCLPFFWAETWNAIRDEKPLEIILRAHEILTRQPREKVLTDYQAFCKDLAQKGFLIEVPEKTGSENEKE